MARGAVAGGAAVPFCVGVDFSLGVTLAVLSLKNASSGRFRSVSLAAVLMNFLRWHLKIQSTGRETTPLRLHF